jgi:hypothetical protein
MLDQYSDLLNVAATLEQAAKLDLATKLIDKVQDNFIPEEIMKRALNDILRAQAVKEKDVAESPLREWRSGRETGTAILAQQQTAWEAG